MQLRSLQRTPNRKGLDGGGGEVVNEGMIRQARTWFVKAVEIAPDEVADEFIRLVSLRSFAL